jgi:Putative adhesin
MKKLLLLLSACALVFAGDSSRYREDFHYSYPQTAGGRFTLDNFNGSVEITGWDQNTVDISGTKYAENESLLHAMQIEASSSGNAVRIKTSRPDPHHGNMGAKYVIRVPRQTVLEDVRSSNGSLRVEDIDGNAHLATSNGSIHLGKIHGNVEARTSNGSVEVNEIDGSFEAETSNGGIRAHLHDTESGHPIRLSTSNGGIDLQVDSPRQNDVVASTSNGPITVRMPGNVSASLHASTNSNGSVRSDFDVLVHSGELSKHRMEGTIGGGGPKIDLTTSNGNINLLKM